MHAQRGSPITVDILQAGLSGPVVILVHSSVSGARQWRRLMDDLKGQFRVRAVNLFGYGKTPPWSGGKPLSRWTIKHVSSKPQSGRVPTKSISLVTRSADRSR
jgi:pimeloyl-ACP methyl ester carboxylesterase